MKVNIKILIQSCMYTFSDIKQIIHRHYTFRLIELYRSFEFLCKIRQEEINRLKQNNQNCCLTFVSWGQNDEPSVERRSELRTTGNEIHPSQHSAQSNCGYSLHVGAMHMLITSTVQLSIRCLGDVWPSMECQAIRHQFCTKNFHGWLVCNNASWDATKCAEHYWIALVTFPLWKSFTDPSTGSS